MDRLDPHDLAEERSLAMHAAVAGKLRASPERVSEAARRIEQWRASASVHPHYIEAWAELLAGPLEDLCAFLVDRSERARALRQVSPFAGVLAPRERWRIHRQVGQRRDRVEAPRETP